VCCSVPLIYQYRAYTILRELYAVKELADGSGKLVGTDVECLKHLCDVGFMK
jgi:hypothetical protein